jgi:hypothetical protein
MKKSFLAAAIAVVLGIGAPFAVAQTTSTSTASGGAGGAGGAAAGGTATGGTATNSNNTSGVSNASGGIGQGGTGGSAQGGSVGSLTATTGGSQASLGDVSVILNQGSSPMGKDGMGVGVDPNTGHIVTDNTVKYSGSYKLKNTPDVGIGGPASGPCNGFSASLGFSIAGLGVGGNTSTVDENCTARETARVAAMLGRMDIANAILENLPAVQAALKAKAAREIMERPRTEAPGPTPATTSPLREDPKIQANRAAAKAQRELEQATREAALQEQQNQAQEALVRQATMAKVNDTLKFTDATTQGNDKTPQEIMAEEATKKLNQSGQQVAAKRQEDKQPPVTISPLPPQPQISASAQPVTSIKSDAPKSQMQPEGKSSERASSLSPDDRIKAAKAAMNFQ